MGKARRLKAQQEKKWQRRPRRSSQMEDSLSDLRFTPVDDLAGIPPGVLFMGDGQGGEVMVEGSEAEALVQMMRHDCPLCNADTPHDTEH